jgi:hypothetical protein
MPRSSAKSKRSRLQALPWAGLLRVGVVVGKRVAGLPAKDRARLGRLLRDSKGRPGSLGAKEREELRRLVGKLDAKGITRELLPMLGGGRGRRRRR